MLPNPPCAIASQLRIRRSDFRVGQTEASPTRTREHYHPRRIRARRTLKPHIRRMSRSTIAPLAGHTVTGQPYPKSATKMSEPVSEPVRVKWDECLMAQPSLPSRPDQYGIFNPLQPHPPLATPALL